MYKRLASAITKKSRERTVTREIRSKILFFVEGDKTEKIYLSMFKKTIPSSKNIDIEIFDRWERMSGISNQHDIVEKTKKYLERCKTITNRQKNKVNELIKLMENHELTIEDTQTKIRELNTFLGEEILSEKDVLLHQLLSIKTCFDFDEKIDKICFVLDRDCGSFTPEQYDQVLEICDQCNYDLGLSTPCFEFFLFLHLTDTEKPSEELLINNKNDYMYNFLRKELREKHKLIFKKNKYDAKFFIEKFEEFEENIKTYSQNNIELKNNLGSSLGTILRRLL
ncbi:RloB domain-containing protein [Exiguobacterium indicum]|uniref:RloB domain-containing protein n=1 Tax=Exiguobacterium indicum TaxID=296995 RepID=UPI002B25CD8E|nr:RloB domain-containing protein [Exiguobacterium indicum]